MTGPSYGTKLVFAPPGRWDPTTHLRLTAEHGVSSWSGVPTQLWQLIGHPDLDAYDLSSLRAVSCGGAPFPPELVHEFTERLPSVTLSNGYGMSETTGTGTLCSGPMMLRHPGSAGGAQVGCEVEIRDEQGNVLSEDEVGEIHLRTACVFLGYWQNDEATEACLDAERWYRTGDYGRISGGVLYVESRMRDLILRGGENIYPIEIEHRLVEHPDIDDAAVVGVDHHELGQEVKAVVVARHRKRSVDRRRPGVGRRDARAVQGSRLRRVPCCAAVHRDREGPQARAGGFGMSLSAGTRRRSP